MSSHTYSQPSIAFVNTPLMFFPLLRSTLFPSRRSSDLTVEAGRQVGRDREVHRDSDGQERQGRTDRHEPQRHHRDKLHEPVRLDRKSTRLNSSHANISYAAFCLKKRTPISAWLNELWIP